MIKTVRLGYIELGYYLLGHNEHSVITNDLNAIGLYRSLYWYSFKVIITNPGYSNKLPN
jgi:hypothetical protein